MLHDGLKLHGRQTSRLRVFCLRRVQKCLYAPLSTALAPSPFPKPATNSPNERPIATLLLVPQLGILYSSAFTILANTFVLSDNLNFNF